MILNDEVLFIISIYVKVYFNVLFNIYAVFCLEECSVQNQENAESIHKILEYWYMIEFLGQDCFPMGNICFEKIKNHKCNLKSRKAYNIKQLTAFADITNSEIMNTVRNEAKECGMSCWGNITVYIGKIKREDCIQNLISNLSIQSDKRPETSTDDIALASFQVTSDGFYVDNSLSLSPVLWVVKQIQNKNDNISTKLNHSQYEKDVFNLEKVLAHR